MKKFITLTIALAAALAISGCSAPPASTGPGDAPAAPNSYSEPSAVTSAAAPPEPSSSQPAAAESEEPAAYSGDFAIEGKWKSVGDYGFGQAQPGSIVVFDGTHCNFFSPQDTYAFYQDGGKYILDATSALFSQNLSFTVKIIDENNVEIYDGSNTTVLKRVG
ncbi:MAG: hypothetical protein LBQ16_04195 [Gracilibacteraceae bacterium]|jgi:hypothetical protein|nr:hypothetical protein [Gracilibacteraceae bacterium]